MLDQRLKRRLLMLPALLVITLLLTACPAPADVTVGEVVDRTTGEKVGNATITMTKVNSEGKVLGSKSCQNCQTLSERIDWPTRGDRVIVQVDAPGYVPWEALSPSEQMMPSTGTGGFKVELTPLAELEAYQIEVAAAIEQVEHLLSEAQYGYYLPEAIEQPLSEALARLRQTDEGLAGLMGGTTAQNDALPSQTTRQFYVDSRQPWQIVVGRIEEGDLVEIEYLEGTWGIWGGPEGVKKQADGAGFVDQDEGQGAPGALLGRIGEGEPFYVGNHLEFTARTAGPLFLGNGDQYPDDNTGGLLVRITIVSD